MIFFVALISHWLKYDCLSSVPPGTKVITHYCAADRMSRNMAVFMKRCITELRTEFTPSYGKIIYELCHLLDIREFAELRFHIYVDGKPPRIDVIVAQMQTSYHTFIRNFFKIPYHDA